MRRKKERSKRGQTNKQGKATQHTHVYLYEYTMYMIEDTYMYLATCILQRKKENTAVPKPAYPIYNFHDTYITHIHSLVPRPHPQRVSVSVHLHFKWSMCMHQAPRYNFILCEPAKSPPPPFHLSWGKP